jgi:DNA-binding response OmpR family regulator
VNPLALVVEDDPDIREVVSEVLRDEGYDTIGVITVDDALAKLRSAKCDVVLLDLGLPGRTGDELLGEMTRANLDVPVVILSASPEAPSVARRWDIGCVRKPFDTDLLVAAVAFAVARRRFPRDTQTP